ncbi:hypothetical protein WICPIJ_006402 [Wickerhamomyces pijperi]|uniref:Uncharacterized protein n=1 Tax=Wickerhamomyces pijperi TaxID=599730 RepID=A0A9P8Q423_WICPI|nr:hypothetical protein WICPIJ_006402 [Wickerhamomyces pijperi]
MNLLSLYTSANHCLFQNQHSLTLTNTAIQLRLDLNLDFFENTDISHITVLILELQREPEEKYSAAIIHLVDIILIKVLKYSSCGSIQRSKESANVLEDSMDMDMFFLTLNISFNFSKLVVGGALCLLSMAVCGNSWKILLATEMLANNMNSSTKEFVSKSFFISTSPGSEVSESMCTLTSGEDKFKAPASNLFCFNFLDNCSKILIPLVKSSC